MSIVYFLDGTTTTTGQISHDELFCTDPGCRCHCDDDRWAEVGDALASKRLREEDAADVIDGKMSLPRVA